MKKTIPFKKELFFKDKIFDIVSISLEHTLHHEKDYLVTGEFIISGEYKIAETSINTEAFEFKVPFDINIDERYELDKMIIDIDDFYYEISNNNVLIVNIEIMLDKIEERCVEEETLNIVDLLNEKKEEIINEIEEEKSQIIEKLDMAQDKIDKVKEQMKGYVTYRVYICKDNDNIEKIMEKYKIEKEDLEKYNNLSDLKIGSKIIIPSND